MAIEIELSDGSIVNFVNYPLNRPFKCLPEHVKNIDLNLENILLNPQSHQKLHCGSGKIFLGFGSDEPSDRYRFPVWLPVEDLTTHVFTAGSIGSGKTSLASRLIAGGLKDFGTVIIGEVKSGTKGSPKGAAFTELSKYLSQRLNIFTYRWPRGNCWFNPLKYLTTKDQRLAFLQPISREKTDPRDWSYSDRAAECANLVLEYMISGCALKKGITLRTLVYYLENQLELQEELNNLIEFAQNRPEKYLSSSINQLKKFKQDLTIRDFFRLDDPKYLISRPAMVALYTALGDKDLLYYSEFHEKGLDGLSLRELEIENILYNRSLVVISQPLEMPSSKFVGPIFWDCLRNKVIELGIEPSSKNGKSREQVLAILDETNELPVGQLGSSLGFLRQYRFGIVEITPFIDDDKDSKVVNRWKYCKQTCQTFLSLTPALEDVAKFIYTYLPNQEICPLRPDSTINPAAFTSGSDNPGVAPRALMNTCKRTALLYMRDTQGVFWIDLENSLLGELDRLLKDANSPNATTYIKSVVDYTLGLVMEFEG
jgi:hypothetical protein